MRLGSVCFAIALVGAALACQKDPPPPPTSIDPAALPSALAKPMPVDHLAEGELVEGKEKLFSITLPRDLHLAWKFPDRGMAKGEVEPERVANYVRARVREGKVTAGATLTVFDDVRTPVEPFRPLRIRIEKVRGECQMEIRDVTPPSDPPPADTAEAWRRLGLNPQGKPLDPHKME